MQLSDSLKPILDFTVENLNYPQIVYKQNGDDGIRWGKLPRRKGWMHILHDKTIPPSFHRKENREKNRE